MDPNDEQQKTTVKTNAITPANELQYYQQKYDEAQKAMMANTTRETIAAFEVANADLVNCQDKYRIGARIILDRKLNEPHPQGGRYA